MGDDVTCPRCKDSGRIIVRTHFPVSYVCGGEPPDHARGVIGARCRWCEPVARRVEEADSE